MMKIALTGATGLVGSRFFDLLKNKFEIIPLSSSFNVDITDSNKVKRFLSEKRPAVIVHLAAKTNVDRCEEDKRDDIKKLNKLKIYKDGDLDFNNLDWKEWKENPSAFSINVVGTKNLADYAYDHNVKLIYVSTDFVFDGQLGEYTEEDIASPIDWYGQTKFYGEKYIDFAARKAKSEQGYLITRISYPFGYRSAVKSDLIWTLADLLSGGAGGKPVKLISDQIITPTFIDDIVRGIEFLMEKNEKGLINLVGNNHLSPVEIGVAIAREFGFDESQIELTTRAEHYKGRAERPFKVMLKNDKLNNLGFLMTDFFEALKKIRRPQ